MKNSSKYLFSASWSVLAFLLLPVLCWWAAVCCGRLGMALGRVFDVIFFASWPAIGLLAIVKAFRTWERIRRVPIVYLIATVIALSGVLWSWTTVPFLESFETTLKTKYNPQEIQAWAIQSLNSGGTLRVLTKSEYPDWAVAKDFRPPAKIGIFALESGSSYSHVKIAWGTMAIGSWGLIVGSTNLPPKGKVWAPGVYFFASPTPWAWRHHKGMPLARVSSTERVACRILVAPRSVGVPKIAGQERLCRYEPQPKGEDGGLW